MLLAVQALAPGFDADNPNGLVIEEGVKETDVIRTTADGSNQPAYKSVIVRLERSDGGRTGVMHASDANKVTPSGRGDESKRYVDPPQLS